MGKPWEIIQGDVRLVCKTLEEKSFDACLCDPPYELSDDGKASAVRVAFEFLFPQETQIPSCFARDDQLPSLVRKVLELHGEGIEPAPSSTVPEIPVDLDDHPSRWDDDVEDGDVRPASGSHTNRGENRESETTEYLGCLSLQFGDAEARVLDALGGLGCGYRSGKLWVGFGVAPACFPDLLRDSLSVDDGHSDVRALHDALASGVSARARAEVEPVPCSLALGRNDADTLSAGAAFSLFAALQFSGAKLIRARARAGRLPAKLQARRIRIVDSKANRALAFHLVVHPQTIASNGFMGKSWDGSKVAYDISTWAEVLRVLKPGAPAMMFGGSRTVHRVTCAIEDAGFEIRDLCLFLHAKGFPKSLDVSKALVQRLGKSGKRKVVGYKDSGLDRGSDASVNYAGSNGRAANGLIPVTSAASDIAKRWEGYGTALKPAHEPIIVARRMLEGTVAENVLKHGVGGIDIDGSRIGTEERFNPPAATARLFAGLVGDGVGTHAVGRWPANVMFDEDAAAMLDEMSGSSKSRASSADKSPSEAGGNVNFLGPSSRQTGRHHGDEGGASRFFFTSKASTFEREAGMERVKKRGVTDRDAGGAQHTQNLMMAANHHPTIKPIDLIRYFAKMLLPPKGDKPRRILVPFSGSGSEMIGCLQAGWDEVVGIERESEYIEIAKQRIAKGGVFSQLQDRHMRRAEPSRAEPSRGRRVYGKFARDKT